MSEQGESAGAAVHLELEGFLAVFCPEDFDFAGVEAEAVGGVRRVIELAIGGGSGGGDDLTETNERIDPNRSAPRNQGGELIKFGTIVRISVANGC